MSLRSPLTALLVLLPLGAAVAADAGGLDHFLPANRQAQEELEDALLALPRPGSLASYHELLSSEPHVAGTPGDLRVVDSLVESFRRMGLEVERHEMLLYLARPLSAELEILSPDPRALPLREETLEEDPYTGDPALDPGWNAYSGSGVAEGEVVFAHQARPEDFRRLAELGVEVAGRIVLARYGGSFRGYKARFAEEAGATGLILYSDPEDVGYVQGLMYPAGGWANGSYIQRGSVLTLPYGGDPLTPFRGAAPEAERLAPQEVDLPGIPVQPVGWEAAREILARMTGPVVPEEWQGGLPLNYRLGGGPEPRLRLRVEQERRLARTFNVVGVLRGVRQPQELVVVGGHHDAWSFGAGDPNAGSILVLEAARAFSELARRGVRPARSIAFAQWGAEEFGILGSVEWVESRRDVLARDGIAYLNLDGAAMGPDFWAAASPSLAQLLYQVARRVPAVADGDEDAPGSVFRAWLRKRPSPRDPERPQVGDLGGGSDHLAFYCHLGLPAMAIGGGGSPGISYHSNYETLHWYRQVVGEDYGPALMLTRMVNLLVARLANADLLPLDVGAYGRDFLEHLESVAGDVAGLEAERTRLRALATDVARRAGVVQERALRTLAEGGLDGEALERLNYLLRGSEGLWLDPEGLPGRPWFRNLFAASHRDSGYAASMLPALAWAVEEPGGDPRAAALRYEGVLRSLLERLDAMAALLPDDPSHPRRDP